MSPHILVLFNVRTFLTGAVCLHFVREDIWFEVLPARDRPTHRIHIKAQDYRNVKGFLQTLEIQPVQQ